MFRYKLPTTFLLLAAALCEMKHKRFCFVYFSQREGLQMGDVLDPYSDIIDVSLAIHPLPWGTLRPYEMIMEF